MKTMGTWRFGTWRWWCWETLVEARRPQPRYLPSTERQCGTYRESESQLASNVASNDKPEMDPLPELLSAGASAAVSTVRWLFV